MNVNALAIEKMGANRNVNRHTAQKGWQQIQHPRCIVRIYFVLCD
jgi:hypothetical protein